MYLCYLDESGTPDIPGNTSHYILGGLAIPIWNWRSCEREAGAIRRKYGLEDSEIHTAWILRAYFEQCKIPNFESMDYADRRRSAGQFRVSELLRLQRLRDKKAYKQAKKNFHHTDAYVHLTFGDRKQLVSDLAKCIGRWGFARLFADCIDKTYFSTPNKSPDSEALEQVVSRFEQYLSAIRDPTNPPHGLLIHDNNETVARKHTALMRKFHREGTVWTNLRHIVEPPLFVNSELTSMVQMVDLCGYALRRYLENKETELFDSIFERADRRDGRVVGVRHFTRKGCQCKICLAHRKPPAQPDLAIPSANPGGNPSA
jgi:hypothetical protein